MNRTHKKTESQYYDYLRSIPIEDICARLGIEMKTRGNRKWFSIRNEKDASVLLNSKDNTFHDFGTGEHGDPITLVSLITGFSWAESKKYLADLYDIKYSDFKASKNNNELTDKEYRSIGIQGDMVSKNIDFDLDLPINELFFLAENMRMSVNSLRKDFPDIYERLIIRGIALPYVQEMKNDYFIDLWFDYLLYKELGIKDAFTEVCKNEKFIDLCNKINYVDKIFNRAVYGTKVSTFDKRDYSPQVVLGRILDGKIKLNLGKYKYKEINNLANLENCTVEYMNIAPAEYYRMKESIDVFPNRAFYNGKTVVLGVLSEHFEEIKLIIESFDKNSKRNDFNDLVTDAEKRNSVFQKAKMEGEIAYGNNKKQCR